jgi:hypothetical protein
MLGVKSYTHEFIEGCRDKAAADIGAFDALETPPPQFEARFFNNLVVVLDAMFMHRLRTVEGKDGNPMNEVRVLSNSLLEHGGRMTADKTIKLLPEKSLLGYEYGSQIEVTRADFQRLSDAYFAAIEDKFS